jgi:hypothetical protein
MICRLKPHPETSSRFVESLEVGIVRKDETLSLVYLLRGDTNGLRIPQPTDPKRRAGLWQRTCFEAFVRPVGAESYFEFNFSPSSEWAAYNFEGYRKGMRPLLLATEPEITTGVDERQLQLSARLELEDVAMRNGQPWIVGLTAVIAERNALKSYWALAHPPGAPDFHHPDCFALELPAAKPA